MGSSKSAGPFSISKVLYPPAQPELAPISTASRVLLQADAQAGILSPAADSTRKRGKALSRRIGQNGSVEVRNGVYRGRYLVDVPGKDRRINKAVILGPVAEMTKSEARRKLKSIIAAEGLNETTYVIPSSELFEKRVFRWRENYLSRQKLGTQDTMNWHLNTYLLPKWGKYPVDLIKEEIVNEWLSDLSRLSPYTQRGIIKTLQMAIGQKFDRKLIHFPSELEAKRQHPCHIPDQMQTIINAARAPYKTLFAVLAETGMRSGEAYGLHVEDVDMQRLVIHIRRSVRRGKPQSPKSKTAYRAIDIQPGLAEMIRNHLNGRTSGYVFQTRNGTPFKHPRILNRVLYPLLKKLGIPKSGTHAFRHGRVSYLVECNTPIETIRAWIGHGSDEMVKLYTHLRPEYRKRVLNAIPSLISPEFHPVHPQIQMVNQAQVA